MEMHWKQFMPVDTFFLVNRLENLREGNEDTHMPIKAADPDDYDVLYGDFED